MKTLTKIVLTAIISASLIGCQTTDGSISPGKVTPIEYVNTGAQVFVAMLYTAYGVAIATPFCTVYAALYAATGDLDTAGNMIAVPWDIVNRAWSMPRWKYEEAKMW